MSPDGPGGAQGAAGEPLVPRLGDGSLGPGTATPVLGARGMRPGAGADAPLHPLRRHQRERVAFVTSCSTGSPFLPRKDRGQPGGDRNLAPGPPPCHQGSNDTCCQMPGAGIQREFDRSLLSCSTLLNSSK